MRGRTSISRLSNLEETMTDMYSLLADASAKLHRWEQSLPPLDVSSRSPEVDELIAVKKEIEGLLLGIPSVTKLLVLAPVVSALEKARDLVLADIDTLHGSEGAEKRWDRAMEDLKRAINRFEFDIGSTPDSDDELNSDQRTPQPVS